MSVGIRALDAADRSHLLAALGSDDTFRDDEIAVATELIDEAIGGSRDYVVLVAVPAGEPAADEALAVLGYICFGPTPMTRATYDLYWIVVHAGARGRGVAPALIDAMERELRARGASAVRVETSELEGYGAARRLYEKMAYPLASRLEDFYREGDALLTYYKRL